MAVVAEVWGSKEGVDRVAGARESTRLPSVAAVVLQEASIGTWGSLHEKGWKELERGIQQSLYNSRSVGKSNRWGFRHSHERTAKLSGILTEQLDPIWGSFMFWFHGVSSVHPSCTWVVLYYWSSQAEFDKLVDVMIIKKTEWTLFKGNVIIYFSVSTRARTPF